MHPILFRIPLPTGPLRTWVLALAAALAGVFALRAVRKQDRGESLLAIVCCAGLSLAAFKWRESRPETSDLPVYAFGVMLGLSLIVGRYITVALSARDGLPKETIGNCYLATTVAAFLGSRLLYVATNPDEFQSVADLVALRNGGLVSYGSVLGLVGSWVFLAPKRIRLLAWADAAMPGVAVGLFLSRIGCYLYGCDFGVQLPESAPELIKRLGTFPHWAEGTLAAGDGSAAFVRHLDVYKGTMFEAELLRSNVSFPVHPTQLYEATLGLLLFGLLLYVRKRTTFRGQVFFTFMYVYGAARFLMELLRDDVERGAYGPVLDRHIAISGALVLFAMAYGVGVSRMVVNPGVRTVSRALAFVPSIIAYALLAPPSFGHAVPYQLSESQVIGLVSALAVAYLFARGWEEGKRHPEKAMSLGDPLRIQALLDEEAPREGATTTQT